MKTRLPISNFFQWCSITLLVLFLGACSERIELKLDSTYTRLIVEGKITTDTTAHMVRLSQSADYLYNNPTPPVSNAIVSITDGVNTFNLTESATQPGYYYTDSTVFGVSGKSYMLTIENVDINKDGAKETYTAESFLPYIAPIDSIQMLYRVYPFGGAWEINMFALDPPTTEFYLFKVLVNNELITDTLNEVQFIDDAFFNGSYSNGVNVQFLMELNPANWVKPADIVTLEMNSISKDYYDFFIAMVTSTGFNVPLFSGPPANPPTNLSNGAIGYFGAYAVSRSSYIVPPQPWVPVPF